LRGDAGFPVRVRFSKHGPVRFISHRDVARVFERAFRIAELPIAFTQGFSPRPKVSFGPALAVGYESDGEYLDVELAETVDTERLAPLITAGLPDGMEVTGVVALADRAPALQEVISSLSYRVTLDGADAACVRAAVEAFLARPEVRVTVTRKGEPSIDDIRPSVLALTVPRPDAAGVELEVTAKPRTLRVIDVVTGLRSMSTDATTIHEGLVVRTHQWIERGGARLEPLDVDRRSAASTEAEEAVPRALEACA
jgi:radical SAM-linked protein